MVKFDLILGQFGYRKIAWKVLCFRNEIHCNYSKYRRFAFLSFLFVKL